MSQWDITPFSGQNVWTFYPKYNELSPRFFYMGVYSAGTKCPGTIPGFLKNPLSLIVQICSLSIEKRKKTKLQHCCIFIAISYANTLYYNTLQIDFIYRISANSNNNNYVQNRTYNKCFFFSGYWFIEVFQHETLTLVYQVYLNISIPTEYTILCITKC